MKTTDIKADTDYAYQARWGRPEKVKVLNPAFDGNVKVQGVFGGTTTERRKGVQIKFKNGTVEVVRPQTILQTWADHQEQASREQAALVQARNDQAAALKRNAETVVALDALLRSKGAVPHPGAYCYDDDAAAALRAAGMAPASRDDKNVDLAEGYEDEYVGSDDHFTSVFYDLSGALKGKFDIDLLALLVQES